MKLVESSCHIPVTCAVCENLVNELILGADVVDRLNAQTTSEQSQYGKRKTGLSFQSLGRKTIMNLLHIARLL